MSLPIPEVTLAITPVCPHCPSMLEILNKFVKQGDIAALHIINIQQHLEFAKNMHIRSVPWLKIGPFILHGLHSQQEMKLWLGRAQSKQGMLDYFTEMLTDGQLESVSNTIQQSPEMIKLFIPLIISNETNINVRLGMGAILEDMAGQTILEKLLEDLRDLLTHPDARVRGDAAHFLSFVKSSIAISDLKKCLDDPDEDVREIAAESLEALSALN